MSERKERGREGRREGREREREAEDGDGADRMSYIAFQISFIIAKLFHIIVLVFGVESGIAKCLL